MTILSYGIASTVLLQRITSDHHWPSDVYAGAVFGYFVAHEILELAENRRLAVAPDMERAGLVVRYTF